MDLSTREPRLSEPGHFVASMDLQANTGDGYFTVETIVWDAVQRRERWRGPHAVFHVHDPGFGGTVNLHPRLRVEMQGPLVQAVDA